MDQDDTFYRLIRADLAVVDHRMLIAFDMPGYKQYGDGGPYYVEPTTEEDFLLFEQVLKDSHWRIKDYLESSKIDWIINKGYL